MFSLSWRNKIWNQLSLDIHLSILSLFSSEDILQLSYVNKRINKSIQEYSIIFILPRVNFNIKCHIDQYHMKIYSKDNELLSNMCVGSNHLLYARDSFNIKARGNNHFSQCGLNHRNKITGIHNLPSFTENGKIHQLEAGKHQNTNTH